MKQYKKKLLITGVSGLLGSNLAYYLREKYEVLGLFNSHEICMDGITSLKCDLREKDQIEKIISNFAPDIVLHCAAQANVDICEDDPGEAKIINVTATKNLVESIKNKEARLIYISSDLVYDGRKGNYSESDKANPLNIYAETKLEGEKEVLKRNGSLVLRTNFFGWDVFEKLNIGEWVITELKNGKSIDGFIDAVFSSIYIFDFAKVFDLIIKHDLSGIYNLGARNFMSKFDFATRVALGLGLDASLIKPIPVDDHSFSAKRSKNISLDISKLSSEINCELPAMEDCIDHFVEDYKKGVNVLFKSFGLKSQPLVRGDVIMYGRQSIDEDDIKEVVEVLRSASITQGPKSGEFEDDLCEYIGVEHAVVVNSGTAALHIACLAIGLGEGDEGITSPNTFVASANCIVYCGGNPVFADIDPRTYNVLPSEIEGKINKDTKVVIPVHFAGQSCDMEAIYKIVKSKEKEFGHKIYIVEDASHAIGSYYKEKKVGACDYSDIATFSFHPVKHITAGEGGAALTNDKELYHKLKQFKSHGITSNIKSIIDKDFIFSESDNAGNKYKKSWYYEQQMLGFNYRITDIQCALGISQLKKLDRFSKKRREIVDKYNEAFKGLDCMTLPYEEDFNKSNFHLYVVCFDFRKLGINRAELIYKLKQRGVQTQVHYIPVYTQPYYKQRFSTDWGDCPNCERYYEGCLSIPLHSALSDKEVEKVINEIKTFLGG